MVNQTYQNVQLLQEKGKNHHAARLDAFGTNV